MPSRRRSSLGIIDFICYRNHPPDFNWDECVANFLEVDGSAHGSSSSSYPILHPLFLRQMSCQTDPSENPPQCPSVWITLRFVGALELIQDTLPWLLPHSKQLKDQSESAAEKDFKSMKGLFFSNAESDEKATRDLTTASIVCDHDPVFGILTLEQLTDGLS